MNRKYVTYIDIITLFQFFFLGQVYFKERNGIKCKFSQDFQCLSILVKGDSEKNFIDNCTSSGKKEPRREVMN